GPRNQLPFSFSFSAAFHRSIFSLQMLNRHCAISLLRGEDAVCAGFSGQNWSSRLFVRYDQVSLHG
ncbi:hypothetical protein ACE1BM_22080, partial [Aeromonas jandaei]